MFNEYEKDGRIIHATEFAYEAIYKAQGYVPRGYGGFDAIPMFGFNATSFEIPSGDFVLANDLTAEVSGSGKRGGDSKDNRADNATKSRRKRDKS